MVMTFASVSVCGPLALVVHRQSAVHDFVANTRHQGSADGVGRVRPGVTMLAPTASVFLSMVPPYLPAFTPKRMGGLPPSWAPMSGPAPR